MSHTEGELQIIRSKKEKYSGQVFIKIKNSNKNFICKFYPWPNGKEATDNIEHFLKSWNSYDNNQERIQFLHDNITVMRTELNVAQQQRDDLLTACERISSECFEAMEGAGLPEFENYGCWLDIAKQAIAKVKNE